MLPATNTFFGIYVLPISSPSPTRCSLASFLAAAGNEVSPSGSGWRPFCTLRHPGYVLRPLRLLDRSYKRHPDHCWNRANSHTRFLGAETHECVCPIADLAHRLSSAFWSCLRIAESCCFETVKCGMEASTLNRSAFSRYLLVLAQQRYDGSSDRTEAQ